MDTPNFGHHRTTSLQGTLTKAPKQIFPIDPHYMECLQYMSVFTLHARVDMIRPSEGVIY